MSGAEENATVDAAVVSSAAAKGVKDALKSAGWLDQSHKPTALSDGLIAFPLNAGSLDPVRMAVAAGEPEALRSVEVRTLDPSCLAAKRPPPKQGRPPKQAGLAPPLSKPKAASQERSFGRGGGGGAGGCALPPAASVRRVACPPGADAQWLQRHVFGRREPAVLTGLELGPCHGGWSAERLAAARCSAKSVSVHVCASPTVDLAGHRAPNTPRNFVFRSMPFAEAVQRCAGGGALGEAPALSPVMQAGERYYLRSVGLDPRKDAADFPSLFPDLAPECHLLPGRGGGGGGGGGEGGGEGSGEGGGVGGGAGAYT